MSYSQTKVSRSVKPRNFFNFSIQAPGRGRKETNFGKIAVIINGRASPIPTKVRVKNILKFDVVKANVKAVPKKGAEQGVDRIVASTPLMKSAMKPFFICTLPSFDPPGVTNSKSPIIFRASIKITAIIMKTNIGDCS